MRELRGHVVNPSNDRLQIFVTDEPGAGGANHRYEIVGEMAANPSASVGAYPDSALTILFQNGAIPEAGVNGITQEVLLEIVADRLQSFQNGPFASEYNATALKHVLLAKQALLDRTRERMGRGVEGTHKV
jgi:hypothetical protein